MRTSITVLIAVAACATFTPYKPVTINAPENAFAKAVRVLTDRGETIDTKDEDAGVITTRWEESDLLGNDKLRVRWQITINGAFLKVVSQCQQKTDTGAMGVLNGTNGFKDCGDRQPNARATDGNAIADAISSLPNPKHEQKADKPEGDGDEKPTKPAAPVDSEEPPKR